MQALTDKGSALKAKFKKFQKLSIVLYALAAIAFVFASNIPLAIIRCEVVCKPFNLPPEEKKTSEEE